MYNVANIDPETRVAYGYISARALDSDLVNTLMDEGIDETAKEAFAAFIDELAQQIQADGEDISDEEAKELAAERADEQAQSFWDGYDACEPSVHGTHEGVSYQSSWLGGALNFFILKSPVITEHARLASPCVPNAGILDTLDGSVEAYDVPADWRYSED